MTDHRVLAGKRVVSLLFGLATALLAVTSCSSDSGGDGKDGAGSCGAGQTSCSNACVDTKANAAHCGGCGKVCAMGQTCSNSACVAGSNPPGSGGSTGTGGATVTPGGGAANPSGGATANGGSVNPGGAPNGGANPGGGATSGGTGAGGAPPVAGAGGVPAGGATGNLPPGYWTSGTWNGCVWTGIDTVAGTTTTNTPKDFTMGAANGAYCVSGSVHADYDSVALLGFNLAEPAAGANCAYKAVDVAAAGPPAVSLSGAGIAVNFTKKSAATLRIQIHGPNGASDPNDRWCYTITEPAGPIFAPWEDFNTECWEGGMGTAPTVTGGMLMEPISAVVFLVPGAPAATPFDYCINGFATGTSAADAPMGGTPGGPLMGTIGGPGSTDLDFQRVKVKAGGKSYIIQNNNWGRPESTDQSITYTDNSFKIVSSTGTKGPMGEPASFPSIYIGASGDTQNGLFSTRSDDNLPKAISAIQTINTTFTYEGNAGDYNATYDVWFAAEAPTMPYNDGISGFLMVWLYQPPGNFPIAGDADGNMPRMTNVTVPGVSGTWNVWVGPRRHGPSPNAPVISYVASTPIKTLTFDLKKFIDHSITNNWGLQPSWLLTDVFAGFEIWTGSAANGLELKTFTAVVQ